MEWTLPSAPEFYRYSDPDFYKKGMKEKYGEKWWEIEQKLDEIQPNKKTMPRDEYVQSIFEEFLNYKQKK